VSGVGKTSTRLTKLPAKCSVGWSIADHMRSELVVDALQMAIWRRRPSPGPWSIPTGQPVHVLGLRHRLRDAGVLGSMGRVASSVDTMIESL
jgi:transposase InsO family protein